MSSPAWDLFVDWCEAAGLCALPAEPATVARFLVEVPVGADTARRRVRAVNRAHIEAGLPPPVLPARAEPTADPAVGAALAACVVGGWPAGLVGRRDAALVALVAAARFTHRHVRALRVASGSIDIGAVPRLDPPGACPACALTRWARTAADIERVGWRSVRYRLADLGEVTAGSLDFHECATPVVWPERAGYQPPLFVAVDRHGGLETVLPLSRRSISAIVSQRLAATRDRPEVPAPQPVPPETPRRLPDRAETLRQRVGQLERLDALTAALEAAVEQADNVTERIGG